MLRKASGVVFACSSLLMLTCFVLLGVKLGYPEILREETGVALAKFMAKADLARALYYGLMVSAVLVIMEAVLFHRVFRGPQNGVWLELGKYSGVCAGLCFIFGFMRWVFLVPFIAQSHAQAAPDSALAQTGAFMFRAFDTYMGTTIGEHMGFLFLSLMLFFFGIAMILSAEGSLWPAILGWLGILIGLGVLYGNTEVFGFPLAFDINRGATKLSLLWMIAVGVFLLASKPPREA
ncbi:MAG: DUF4386 domain-containing protein [Desulfarculaceae bacterium]|nr:DUF4386 domain-containing protein [Desulfarculaceae bacterium]